MVLEDSASYWHFVINKSWDTAGSFPSALMFVQLPSAVPAHFSCRTWLLTLELYMPLSSWQPTRSSGEILFGQVLPLVLLPRDDTCKFLE